MNYLPVTSTFFSAFSMCGRHSVSVGGLSAAPSVKYNSHIWHAYYQQITFNWLWFVLRKIGSNQYIHNMMCAQTTNKQMKGYKKLIWDSRHWNKNREKYNKFTRKCSGKPWNRLTKNQKYLQRADIWNICHFAQLIQPTIFSNGWHSYRSIHLIFRMCKI